MDLFSAMQAFVTVYETRSFSAAAKRMRVGQPAVSKLVAGLEDHIGAKLLLRSTRGLSPTSAGKRFYEHAVQALESAGLAERAARGGEQLTGRLRVTGTISFVRRVLVPSLPAFYAKHPDVELDLLLDDHDVGLVAEGIEVALRMGRLASSELPARKIGSAKRFIVGTASYFRQHGEPKMPEDLRDHAALVFSGREGGERITFARDGVDTTVELKPRLRVNVLEGLRAAILADLGVASASEWMFGEELHDGRLKTVLPEWTLPRIELWAVLPGGRRASPLARAFLAFVESVLAKTPFAARPNTNAD